MISVEDGTVFGSIGGGHIEHQAKEKAMELLKKRGGSSLTQYSLTDDAAACGGTINVFSQYLIMDIPRITGFFAECLNCFSENDSSWLIMEVPVAATSAEIEANLVLAGRNGIKALAGGTSGKAASVPVNSSHISPVNINALLEEKPCLCEQNRHKWFSLPLIKAGFVYIFGAGHIAMELVPLLSRLEFRCVVFDDRKEYAQAKLFPAALKVIKGNFTRIGRHLKFQDDDFVVIVTKGHQWDFQAQAFALKSPAAYIGVIGSKQKHAVIEEQLLAAGFSPGQIHAPRVHAPIGIKIGSKTPAEIALSIAAELVKVRNDKICRNNEFCGA